MSIKYFEKVIVMLLQSIPNLQGIPVLYSDTLYTPNDGIISPMSRLVVIRMILVDSRGLLHILYPQ